MEVEIVYRQTCLICHIDIPCSALFAIQASGILQQHPEIDLNQQPIGVFGQKITLTTPIQDQDRIEIYQPLLNDPKKARKLRSKTQGVRGKKFR